MLPLRKIAVRHLVAGLILSTGLLLLPVTTQAQSASTDEQYRTVLFELIKTLQAQIELLQKQLIEQKAFESQVEYVAVERPKTVFNGAPVMKRYAITKESDVKNITDLKHRQYLKRVYEIFPDEFDSKLREFMVFKDKNGEFGAFVETLPPNNEYWSFAINTDLLGKERTDTSTELIVHELAHIISYESIAGRPLPQNATCHAYFKSRGCPKGNSYLTAYTKDFWSVSDLSRALKLRKNPDAVDAADEYFQDNESEYVSGYAALSPEEDFAESYAQYVTNRKIQNSSMASQKLWWFDQFTNLKNIRSTIK